MNLSDRQIKLFDFIKNGKSEDKFTEKLKGLVEESKHNTQWRQGFMTWEMLKVYERQEAREEGLAEGREEGRAEGLAEGLAEGAHQAKLDAARRAITRNKLTLEEIAEDLELPFVSVEQLAQELQK